jgi:hypothetical protein
MSGGEFLAESRSTLDFLVQTGILIGFLAAGVGFLYRTISNRMHKVVEEKIAPVDAKVDKALAKLDEIKVDTVKEIRVKEEVDRERFRNIKDSQDFIKEQIQDSIEKTEETKKKLDVHLVEAATFIGRTENALDHFRMFMQRSERSEEKRSSNPHGHGSSSSSGKRSAINFDSQ